MYEAMDLLQRNVAEVENAIFFHVANLFFSADPHREGTLIAARFPFPISQNALHHIQNTGKQTLFKTDTPGCL